MTERENEAYNEGVKEGYDKGYAAGFIAGDRHAQEHFKAAQEFHAVTHDMIRQTMDSKPVYQGKLVMCASCGKPVGDTPVQKNEYGCIFTYCSTVCRDCHAVGV